jgi:hypothetical protein
VNVAETRKKAGFDLLASAESGARTAPAGAKLPGRVTKQGLSGWAWALARAVAEYGIPFGINEKVNFHSRRLVPGSRMRFGHRNAASDR